MNQTTTTTSGLGGDEALLHVALLYADPRRLRAAVQEFVADAMASDEPVLAVLPTGSLEIVGDALASLDARVEVHDMTEVGRNPSTLLPMIEAWLRSPGRADSGRARVISEPMWAERSYAEASECLRHEALLNHVLAAEPLTVLCPYDLAGLDAEVIAGAELTHPRLLDERGARASSTYGDPVEIARGDHWPQHPPSSPAAELAFEGDLHALRDALARDPHLAPLQPERREDLVFAVNEAVTNAVRHGDGRCRARVWQDGDRVVSEVVTMTRIDDPLAGRRRPERDAVDGRGLWLINQMCDLVELRSGPDGASLRMHMAAA